MRRLELSPAAYRRITLAALVALAVIVVTGAAVRLTGSGLGCPDWPTCNKGRLVPPWEHKALVEYTNRVFTGVVSVASAVAVLGSLVRRPRRRDLVWLSVPLVVGVFAQALLGALAVRFKLRPELVMAHFLLSMVLLADAVVLHERASRPDDAPSRPVVGRDVAALGRLLVVAAAVTLFLGTVVTGAGPHGGDEHVERLPFLLPDVARLHGTSVMIFLALTLLTLWRLRAAGAPAPLLGRAELLLGVLVAQAAVGYTQYFTGVPAVLVGIHVAGAAAVWVATLRFVLALSAPAAALAPEPGPVAETALVG